jgi:hypothetical protein
VRYIPYAYKASNEEGKMETFIVIAVGVLAVWVVAGLTFSLTR